MPIIEGASLVGYQVAGVPGNGTSEVQTLTVTGTPTGGTFKVQFRGATSAAIAYNAAAAAVQTALRAMPTIGSTGVTCGGGALPGVAVTLTFGGTLSKSALPLATVVESALTGGTTPAAAIAETTPGVDAAFRGAPTGALAVNTTAGALYINTGTAADPTWALV